MPGLFDPSMFPNAMASGAPQMGLLARLQQMINQPGQSGGFPQQPGGDAMGQGGLIPPPQGQQAPQSAPPMSPQMQGAPQGGGFMDALSGFLGNHQNALLGLGAGIASGGLRQGVPGMAQGAQQDYSRNMQQNSLAGTYSALIQAGVPEGVARAAALNPELLKTIAPEYFSAPKVVQTGESPLGKTFQLQSAGGKFSDIPSGGSGGNTAMSLLAPGVRQMDSSLTGDDYLKQFSPEVQGAVKSYINGDVMPTGNSRNVGIANFAKTIAQKYGQDTGQPVSDITYAQRRKMQVDLASSGNSSMGGILSNGESSFKHLADYTASAADQGNASHNFPFGGAIAHGQNYVGNALGGSDTLGKVKAINDNLGKYGAESTKFYAGTGGGVEERLNALKEMNGTTTSGEEAAAYAEKEKNLMLDRLNTKFQEIRNSLGEERGNAEIAKHTPDIEKNIAKIDANIAKLRGGAAAPTGATQATAPLPAGWKFLGTR